jgi:hypothetical protein
MTFWGRHSMSHCVPRFASVAASKLVVWALGLLLLCAAIGLLATLNSPLWSVTNEAARYREVYEPTKWYTSEITTTKKNGTNLVSHSWHVLSTYSLSLCLSYKESKCLVFSQNKNERIGYTTCFDLRSYDSSVRVFDDLSLSTIYKNNKHWA